MLNLSENTRRRIAILGQVPPVPMLTFVVESREKAKVGCKTLSDVNAGVDTTITLAPSSRS